MRECVYLLAVSAVCISCVTAGTTKLAGPYDLSFRRLEHCKDEGTKELGYHTRLNKFSKYEYSYNGDCIIPDNTDLSIAATVFKKMQSGSWAKAFDHQLNNACEDLKTHFFDAFRKYTEEYMHVPPVCPIPAGLYKAKDWIVHIKDTPMNELEYGEYKVEAVFMRGDDRVGCALLYVDVEEKVPE